MDLGSLSQGLRSRVALRLLRSERHMRRLVSAEEVRLPIREQVPVVALLRRLRLSHQAQANTTSPVRCTERIQTRWSQYENYVRVSARAALISSFQEDRTNARSSAEYGAHSTHSSGRSRSAAAALRALASWRDTRQAAEIFIAASACASSRRDLDASIAERLISKARFREASRSFAEASRVDATPSVAEQEQKSRQAESGLQMALEWQVRFESEPDRITGSEGRQWRAGKFGEKEKVCCKLSRGERSRRRTSVVLHCRAALWVGGNVLAATLL
eukprot:3774388-Pleurochrysis_carterae.AAC.1